MTLATEKCAPANSKLGADEASAMLEAVPAWAVEGGELVKHMKFADFAASLAYVNRLGAVAEEQNHHPDIGFGWGYATIRLMTHDKGGLTRNDFIMAAKIDALG